MPAVQSFGSDFVLLQELPRPHLRSPEELWIGDNPRQGMSVISCTGIAIKIADCYDESLQLALPVEIRAERPFQLLALWMKKEPVHYVPNLVAILEHYRSFIERCPTVVAGDFNASVLFDSAHPRYPFSSIAATFEKLALCSAYHSFTGEVFGKETRPTLYHTYNRSKPFHIDYVFIPEIWRKAAVEVTVGNFEDYEGLSDHRPLSIQLSGN